MIDNKLKPFSQTTSCPKCGTGKPDVSDFPPLTNEQVDAMPFGVAIPIHPMFNPGFSVMRVRFCPGGQEPETAVELDPMTASLQAAMATMTSIVPESKRVQVDAPRGKLNICAGIGEEHLHATCNNCQYEFLMATKDAAVLQEQNS